MAEDLFQESVLTLWYATKKYDWRRGYAFATYAQHAVYRSIHRNSWEANGVYLPDGALKAYYRLRKILNLTEEELTLSEVAAQTGDNIDMVRHLMYYHSFVIPVELDALVMPDGSLWTDLKDTAPGLGSELEARDTRRRLLEMVDALPLSLSAVLQLSFGLCGSKPSNRREIAETLGLTEQAVRKLEQKALKLLRERYADELADLLHEG
jgi:RNA polymerase primary sigma factor